MELEHSFQALAPDVRLCAVDNALLALHPSSGAVLVLDVCGGGSAGGGVANERLQPLCPAVQLQSVMADHSAVRHAPTPEGVAV